MTASAGPERPEAAARAPELAREARPAPAAGPVLHGGRSRDLAPAAWHQPPCPAPCPPPYALPYPPQYLQPWPPGTRPPVPGLATASMVLGILAFLLEWLGLATLTLALLAITLGIVSWSRARGPASGRGQAIAGVILGSAGLAAYILWGIVSLGLLFII